MKRKRIILISVLLIIIIIIAYLYLSGNKTRTYVWRTAPVERGTVRREVKTTGSINALTTVQVGTQVSGTISKLFADFNSIVEKDQIIAVLDTTFLAATRDEAQAAFEKAALQLNQAKMEFERTSKLFETHVVAQADFDMANTNYETSKSSFKAVLAQLRRAKINLQYATIRAPISGVVVSRNVDVGQTVVASFNTPTLFTIANDLTKMQVYANVDEADIGQVKKGQAVTFTVDAYPDRSFTGEIKQIRLQPNTIQNVVNYTVIIDVSNSDLKLLPGLTANIDVNVLEHANVLKVQSTALHFIPPAEFLESAAYLPDSVKSIFLEINKNGGFARSGYLWVKKGDYIFPHLVHVGLTESGYAEVTGDIKESDQVITGINDNTVTDIKKNPFVPSFQSPKRRSL